MLLENNSESDDYDFEGDEESDEDLDDDADEQEPHMGGQHPFGEPPFMRELDLDAMNASEFPEYANLGNTEIDDELYVGRQFNDKEVVIKTVKHYSISKGVDYKVKNGYFWKIQKYNGPHTCTVGIISQDHRKLDTDTIAECIKLMVKFDPSFKIKVVIGEIQSRFGYMISYRKTWLAKQKAIEKVFGQWEASFEALPQWCIAMCDAVRGSIVKLDATEDYRNGEMVSNVQILRQVFWSFGHCIRAFQDCKPLVQVDGTHLYGKYKGVLLVVVAQDENQNILQLHLLLLRVRQQMVGVFS
ncbi:uncharacterized protein LOC113860033 [Abrus precatorius]|uniref:Uncharacterized protein LOC113860033 n=1 Tax=Abrus precatorius TaxID=3816 RepID=A0A8B8KX28_ABRPR|nr:uncharacterized protein LOC113860033 [Abrus precatorius]